MRAAATIAALTATRGVVNFGLQVALAAQFGASRETDAYFVVIGLVIVGSDLLISLLAFAALPVLIGRWQEEADAERGGAWTFELTLVAASSGLALLVSACLALGASGAATLLAPGFSSDATRLTAELIRLSAPGFLMYTIALVLGVALQAQQRFTTTALVPVLPVAGALVFLAVSPSGSAVDAPIIGFDIGSLLALVMQIVLWRRLPGRRPLLARVRAAELRELLGRTAPMIVAAVCGFGLPITLRIFASTLGTGAVAAVGFASQVVAIPTALLVTPVATVLFARFSVLLGRSRDEATRVLEQGCAVVLLGAALAGILIAALAEPIVQLAFARGSFTVGDVATTATALRWLAVGLVALAGAQVLGRAIVAEGSVWTFAVTWAAALVGFSFVGSLLGPQIGVGGLAFAYSAAWFALAVGLGKRVRRAFPGAARGWFAAATMRVLAGGVVAGAVAWAAYRVLFGGASPDAPPPAQLVGGITLSGSLGAIVFVGIIRVMNGPEARIASGILLRGVGRGRPS